MGKLQSFINAVPCFRACCVVLLNYFFLAFLPAYALAEESNYWQASFPSIKTISTQDVAQEIDSLLVIDVRPAEEFNIAHIKGAYNYSVGNALFIPNVKRLRQQFPERKIIFYCNGKKCGKSYTGALKAQQADIDNIFVYSSGIRTWLIEQPELTVFKGESPADLAQLISDEDFDKHLLTYEQVKAEVGSAIVIDIRDQYQRHYIPVELRVRHIPFRRLIPIIKWQKIRNQRLIFIDATGQQVRWLQYYLESERVRNYFFLKDGVDPLAKQPL